VLTIYDGFDGFRSHMTLSITLPFPPSTNNLFAQVGRKRVPSGRAKAYAVEVKKAVVAAGMPAMASGEARLVIAAWMPNLRARDLDNLLKAPLDGLVKAGVLADDSLITDIRIYRAGLDRLNPRLTVWLEAL
jgi:crossover junction endodeoxyribonuclease RusA